MNTQSASSISSNAKRPPKMKHLCIHTHNHTTTHTQSASLIIKHQNSAQNEASLSREPPTSQITNDDPFSTGQNHHNGQIFTGLNDASTMVWSVSSLSKPPAPCGSMCTRCKGMSEAEPMCTLCERTSKVESTCTRCKGISTAEYVTFSVEGPVEHVRYVQGIEDAVCMYVCLYVCMYVCLHVCLHVCVYGYINMCVCVCVCVDIFIYVYIYICIYIYIYILVNMLPLENDFSFCWHTYMHTYIDIYIHALYVQI